MPVRIGPVVFLAAGDAFVQGVQVAAMIWVGGTTVGDKVVLRHRGNNELLWEAVASGTQTYLGANIGTAGMSAPNGFYAERLDSAKLMVYLKES